MNRLAGLLFASSFLTGMFTLIMYELQGNKVYRMFAYAALFGIYISILIGIWTIGGDAE